MSRKLTKEEIVNREADLLSGEYEMLGDYAGAMVKTLFKHNKCGSEWMITPVNFYTGHRCPKCALKRVASKNTLSKEEFITREPDLLSRKYEFVGEYVKTQNKSLFKHNECGYEWEITPNSFHGGARCPRCAGVARLTKEIFCMREEDIQSEEYEMLGKYEGANIKTLFRHNLCGCEYMVTPSHFYEGRRCPRCRKNKKHISGDSKLG